MNLYFSTLFKLKGRHTLHALYLCSFSPLLVWRLFKTLAAAFEATVMAPLDTESVGECGVERPPIRHAWLCRALTFQVPCPSLSAPCRSRLATYMNKWWKQCFIWLWHFVTACVNVCFGNFCFGVLLRWYRMTNLCSSTLRFGANAEI